MISSLRGKVSRLWGNYTEIEVSGVGYLVWTGRRNYTEGQEIKIQVYLAVSENEALCMVLKILRIWIYLNVNYVSGIGPKVPPRFWHNRQYSDN